MKQTIVLLTAKSTGSERRDRLFLVRGSNDSDCMTRFVKYAKDPEIKYELDIDTRTIKYLGDGPESETIAIVNESGVVELDTTNNHGYAISIDRD